MSLKRFVIENSYQDSNWLFVCDYGIVADAYDFAAEMSHNALVNGTVRVRDIQTGRILRTYPAGSKGYYKEHTQPEVCETKSREECFFLIWSPTGPTPPRQRITTRERAVFAAKDMALKHPGQEFYVMQAQARAQTSAEVRFDELT